MSRCDICNNKLGIINKLKVSNGFICPHCSTISQSFKTDSIEDLKKYWDINHKRISIFNKTSVLKSLLSEIVTIDNNNKLFIIGKYEKLSIEPIVFSFNEISSYNFESIGAKSVTTKKGGISRAIVGGVVAGPVGAIVGAGTAKQETQTVDGPSILKINFVIPSGNYSISMQSPPIGFTNFLNKCIFEDTKETNLESTTDEIKKYKELLDNGIITEEEFSLKKKQLLNI